MPHRADIQVMTTISSTSVERARLLEVGLAGGEIAPWAADGSLAIAEEEVLVHDGEGNLVGTISHAPLAPRHLA
jgi:hypothetical protein